jgi:hypothetical protein
MIVRLAKSGCTRSGEELFGCELALMRRSTPERRQAAKGPQQSSIGILLVGACGEGSAKTGWKPVLRLGGGNVQRGRSKVA